MASADRIYCTTTDEGTGDIELDPTPFSGEWLMPPSSLEGKEVDYSIVHRTQVEVETGSCIYSHSTLTLLRGAGTARRSTAGEGTKVAFSPGVKDVILGFGAFGLNIAQSGGATINEVASGAIAYQFNSGGQYALVADRKHRAPEIMGVANGALTALMYVALPDPDAAGEGYDSTICKGESSTFGVTVVGLDTPVVVQSVDAGTDLLTFTGYNPTAGDPVILDGGTAPAPLALGTIYFARDVSTNTAKLAATVGGAAINITSTGSGLTARKGIKTLTRLGHSARVMVTGKTPTTLKWELVLEGARFTPLGLDLANAADAAAAQTLLGPVTSIADGTVVQADLQADTLASLADTRPGVVDVLSGFTLVNDFSPPHGLNPQTPPGQDVVALQGGGSSAVLLTPSGVTAGEITCTSSGAVRVNVVASSGNLVSPTTLSFASDYVTVVFAGFSVSSTAGSHRPFGKFNHTAGFGIQASLMDSAGNFLISGYTAPSTLSTIKTIAGPGFGKLVIAAFSYRRATGALRVAYNWGARYDESTVTVLADWAGQTTLSIAIGSPSTFTFDAHWFGTKEYTSSALATRAQLEALVRDMEQHAARKIGHGDLSVPVLEGLHTHFNVTYSDAQGSLTINPATSGAPFFEFDGSMTGDLTVTLSTTAQKSGPAVFVVWNGTNNGFNFKVQSLDGEVLTFTATGWVVSAYWDDETASWKSSGVYKRNSQVTGAKFTRAPNTGTSITANAALDSTIQLLRGSSAVAVSLAVTSGSNTQIVLVKETDQVITVSVGGAAVYRLPGDDDGVTRTASFVVTGTVTLIGDAGVWMVIGATNHATALFNHLDLAGFDLLNIGDGCTFATGGAAAFRAALQIPEVLSFAVSDEGTALTTGVSKLKFRMPFPMTLTAVRASVGTAPTGSTLVVDINEGGTTILSTKLSIDATEKTSQSAAAPAVISDAALGDDSEITIDIDQVGSTTAGAGLKVLLIGRRT